MPSNIRPRRLVAWAAIGAALAMTLAFGPTASATPNNPGTIKVHGALDTEPDSRNEPHVSCLFFVVGFNMADTLGTYVIWAWSPTGDGAQVASGPWIGTPEPDGRGSHFIVGPLSLPAGHYRVEAFSSTGHPGDSEHFSKTKTFWVDACLSTTTTTTASTTSTGTTTAGTTTGGTTTGGSELACPTDLVAVANGDGSVTLTFTAAPGSDGTRIYRANGTATLAPFATLDAGVGLFEDGTTVAGYAYGYVVVAVYGDQESAPCPVAEVSSIPEFPTLLASGLAATAGVVALAWARRKL